MLLRWSNSLIGAGLTSHVVIIGAWAFHGLRCSLARLFHPEALGSSRVDLESANFASVADADAIAVFIFTCSSLMSVYA